MTHSPTDNEILPYYKQNAVYPWQLPLWKQLFSDPVATSHFPHALLLSGVSGIGKTPLAFYLARALLCQTPQENLKTGLMEPCQSVDNDNVCRSCQLFSAATHPDLYHVTTAVDKKVIPVDDIRALIQWSVLNSQFGGKKVILIEPAEAMNLSASNSLLKTLEEPVSNTIIILLTNKKQALLPTIRSRCRTIDMALPDNQITMQWLSEQNIPKPKLMLSLASGAPLLALQLSQSEQLEVRYAIINQLLSVMTDSIDPLSVAEALFKQTKTKPAKASRKKSQTKTLLITPYDIIYWFDSLVSDLARLAQMCAIDIIINIDYYDSLQQLSNRLYLKRLLQLSDSINKAYYEIQGQININLLFEKLLIDWNNCQK
ncbi:MAG: AAA family ATPase [gamma proteobacterium symbiont of Bathyaustriella thionipta]|nr:AAA family ATPase [gamma proteobacterium symbiont of Bathyaustriella thionipta]MCU7949117.1 AAA family ATPase [gamma proteobacterium symbiont of Bathyaustriella thionipta]MCU7954428.1 AAA family ATPase [gamma proteobacterium symbiont of Bathyaustriella thionipta]MCU7955710.1 AAA family ATPase [gamma proteobacterium symbiont of Bathyaustriella thionipta]MCU7966196.1 AAA family ATPase [gamma proteobacterium symbiont of Bathyaustriella thionipta]